MRKFFRSLRFRLVASYLAVILLAMGIAAGLSLVALDRAFLDVLRQNLLAQAERVAQTTQTGEGRGVESSYIISYALDEAQPSPESYEQTLNVLPGYHARVVNEEGLVLLGQVAPRSAITHQLEGERNARYDDRRRSVVDFVPLLERLEVQRALVGEPATAVRVYDWAPRRRVLYAAYPIRADDDRISNIVYIASPIPRFSLGLLPDTFGIQALGGAMAATGLAGLAGFLLARTLTRPLHRLTEAAAKLARGERAPPIPPAATDEVDRLGKAFNTMNTHLTAAHRALAEQAQQREAILHGLSDAVVAVDGEGDVILANPAAGTLQEAAAASLQHIIHRTLESGEPQLAELSAHGQVFELLTAPLRDEAGAINGAVALGHDVTAYRQLDRLRTNFVSDVSHELRTPLTAIKGFIETLLDGAAEDVTVRDRFLRTIAAETERLTRLTNDLLLLTRADAGRLDLRLAPTDVATCARRVVDQLAIRAREKRIAVTVEEPATPPLALVDADRVHQVLVNLLDNGLRYTPVGGRVTISFKCTDGQIVCSVTDTGPGIPAGELPHLFQRFYRVDRARARAGDDHGAGLGLSIVQAIVEAHGGRIWVESKAGDGSTFHFTLPAAD